MSNLRIGYLNRADSATLTASPVVETTAPITYLQNDSRGYVMRSTGLTAQEIKGEWGGTAYAIGCCVLWRHNLITNDTWRIQLYSDVAWTTSVYDSGAVDVYTDNIFDNWDFAFSQKFFTEIAGVKSFKITLTSASNPDGFMEAGRLFLGPYTEAAYNPAYGAQIGYETSSTQSRSDGGSLLVNTKAAWRNMTFDMWINTEATRAAWLEIGRYVTNVKTVFVSVFPESSDTTLERDYSVMGKFTVSPMHTLSSFNKYDFSIKLVEI